MSQALQKVPQSGKLWALKIEIEPQATRKAQSLNALNKVDNDSDLFIALAKIFWLKGKLRSQALA